MRRSLSSSDGLIAALRSLAREAVDANACNRLFQDLLESIATHNREINHSPAMWSLTLQSLRDNALLHLCRIYDNNPRSLGLPRVLEALGTCRETAHRVDAKVLRSQREATRSSQPVLKKLMVWRGNVLAHRGATVTLRKQDLSKKYPISRQEFGDLVTQAMTCVNEYLGLLTKSAWSLHLVNQEDYMTCLSLIRRGIQGQEEDLDREARKIQRIIKRRKRS